MSLPLVIQGLGTIGIFSSRAFLPAFATALLLRFGPEVPWLAQAGLLPHIRDVPTWFTSDTSLVVLGLLSALELVAERVPEVKPYFDEIHDYLKTAMAALTFLGVIGASDRAVVGPMVNQASIADYLPVLIVSAGTFLMTRVRAAIVGVLGEADEDDDLGLQGLIRIVEDLWGTLGAWALILLPLLTLACFGLAVVLLGVVLRSVEARERAAKVPCGHCGNAIYAGALACPHCKTPNPSPRAVGLLGLTRNRPADPTTQPFRLVAVKRCPVCAGLLGRRDVRQTCGTCGHTLDDLGFFREYIGFIDRRVPWVVAACALLGLIPVLGVIPAVILYRLTIVAPFRRYIPPGQNFLMRWGIRLVSLVLAAFQWVPLLGGLLVPAMALANYGAYRTAYRKLALGV
jgi:hypothetical protein